MNAWRTGPARQFGVVQDGAQGPAGPQGSTGPSGAASTVPGPEGNDGWTPILAGEADGTRTLIKVVDWTGGEGIKPATGMYIGTTGYVATKALAFNFNAAKRVRAYSGVTNASGVAAINYSDMGLTVAPQIVALPATTPTLSGPTRSAASAITLTGCTMTVQQQAILTGVLSFLVGATANVLVVEQ
ncbi:MAG: hypothetical protein QM681_17470 [Novosphingobium sp.]